MKTALIASLVITICFLSTPLAFAQTTTPTPTPTEENEPQPSGSGVLHSFISGFDWISSGLVFHTPSILDNTIKLNDGTELAGLSEYRNIFYDIAIPLFVLIISAVAFSHITNDNAAQLRSFFQKLIFVVVLFIITPSILSYSIQFVNLLNAKIIAQNTFNLSTLINDFLGSFMETPGFRELFGMSFRIPTFNTVLQLIILIISIGFLLIGFIYIIFQAVIRFIALLILSVLFPVVLPFALSPKTENITNTYFRTWFTFLIQQPAFVLGFAIVSTILTSIVQAHNASIGTLFIYSGSLIFLGGVNVFIGRIFGEGWSLVSSNAQGMIGSHAIHKSFGEIKRGAMTGRATGVRSYAGKFLGQKIGIMPNQIKQRIQDQQEATRKNSTASKDSQNETYTRKKLAEIIPSQQKGTMKNMDARKQATNNYEKPILDRMEGQGVKQSISKNNQDSINTPSPLQKKPYATNTKQATGVKPITIKRPEAKQIVQRGTVRVPARKK